jgi:peptide/nickel transport system permease protein
MAIRGFVYFTIRKVLAAVITIIAITCVNFAIFRMAPGDPIRMMFRDPRVSAEQMQQVRIKFGLDKPLSGQFLSYLKELSRGDLGISFWQKRQVLAVIADRVPQTLLLVITALVIAIIFGTLLGAMAGWKSGSRFDSIVMSVSLAVYSIPTFAMGLVMLLIFAFFLSVFPLGGISTPASGYTGVRQVLDVMWHMILPAISIIFWYVGEYVLLTRSSMIDVMGKDYITTARAKGLKESTIRRGHALRNALLPVVTMSGVNFAFAIGGVIEAETVFSWPGVGRLVYDAVMKRDYPLLQGIFLVFAVSVVLLNLLVDLIYGYIDPRIKVGGEKEVG